MMRDVSTGSRREVVGVRSSIDMEIAVAWLQRGDAPDIDLHCYLRADGTFGVWTNGGPADAPQQEITDLCACIGTDCAENGCRIRRTLTSDRGRADLT